MKGLERHSDLAPWLASFVEEEGHPDKVDAWVTRTAAAINLEVEAVRQDPEVQEEVRATIRDHWTAFLTQFDSPDFSFHLVDAGRVFAMEFARRQLPLESMINLYRVAQQSTWDYITDVVNELPPDSIDHAAVLIYFWSRASTWIDRSITESVAVFQTELARVMAGTEAQRYDVVRDVLAGKTEDRRAVSTALGGYPLSVMHTAVVLESQSTDAVNDLRTLAVEIATLTGVQNPLLVKPGGRRLWMWLGSGQDLDLDVLRETDAALRPQVAVGVGSAVHGLEGFAVSHREALEALRVGGAMTRRPGYVTCYSDIEMAALLRCTPEVDRFIERALGPLIQRDIATDRIRETVQAYLNAGGNVDEASQEIFVHRNTVRYRLNQAEELLGHKVVKVNAPLAVALSHFRAFHEPSDG